MGTIIAVVVMALVFAAAGIWALYMSKDND